MPKGPLTQFFTHAGTVWTPRVLKDGSDSVGALGALNRVYLNIGLFSEEWLRHFNALRRRQADHAHSDRRRAKELGLLARDRGAKTRTSPRSWSPQALRIVSPTRPAARII